jgi:hypothetical protein
MKWAAWALLFGIPPLIGLAALITWNTLGWLVGVPVHALSVLPAGLAWIISGLWVARSLFANQALRRGAGALAVQLLLFGLGLALCGGVYDFSFDGQWYHQEGVLRLSEGWNPVYDYESGLAYTTETLIKSYPKAPWVAAAALYRLTGELEAGKVFNLLLIGVAFALALAALLEVARLRLGPGLALAALAALNPVSLYQSMSFYVDGQVATLVLIVICLGSLILARPDRPAMAGLIASVGLLANTKFTALVFALLLICGGLAWAWWQGDRAALLRVLAATVGGGILALLIGANPYLTNLVAYQNPFYPVLGTQIDVMELQRPSEFASMHRVERLGRSLFAHAENPLPDAPVTLKWPLTLAGDPLQFYHYDLRLSGLGPFFSGALILGALGMIVSLRPAALAELALAGVVLASALSHPEAWWARLAPQLWLLPLIAALACFRRRHAAVGWVIVAVLVANLGIIADIHFSRVAENNARMRAQLAAWAADGGAIAVDFGIMRSNQVRFAGWGIPVRPVDQLLCPEPTNFMFAPWGVRLCRDLPALTPPAGVEQALGLRVALDAAWYPYEPQARLRWMRSPATFWVVADQRGPARVTLAPALIHTAQGFATDGALTLTFNDGQAQLLAVRHNRPLRVELLLQRGVNVFVIENPAGNSAPGSVEPRELALGLTQLRVEPIGRGAR